MPNLKVKGKVLKKFSYDQAGIDACQAAAREMGGECIMDKKNAAPPRNPNAPKKAPGKMGY